jgi:hypothetical protein
MIVVGTTLCAFAMQQYGTWAAWLDGADALRTGRDVRFFAAIEVDARGLEPFGPLLERLRALDGEWWTFMLDDGRTEVTTENRLRHIAMGWNLLAEYASTPGITHLLQLGADTRPPDDALDKLLEVDHGLVAGDIPIYGLHGPTVEGYPFPVQTHMASTSFLLIRRDVFKRLRWRWDLEEGLTDDPCYRKDALELLGVPIYVRKDCMATHWPNWRYMGRVERRFPGRDMRVVRISG